MFIENLVVVSLALAVFGTVLVLIHQMYKSQQDSLMEFLERYQKANELTQERLMNRAMSRDWQTYVQMQSGLNSNLTPSEETAYPGMSDEEEIRRSGAHPSTEPWTDPVGYGDTNYEVPTDESMMEAFRELGIVE